MANLTFAIMDTEHLDAILSIENMAHSHPWKASMITDLNGRGAFNYVLMADERVVGYFYAQNIVGEVSLLNIAVSPREQGKGYGRALLNHFLEQCESREAESAWLEVRESNQAAVSLYLDEGFNEVDRRRDYYPSDQGREDAVIMSYYFLFSS
ncbi:ribosomal protein S18-alanine N-acetyltransferase [Vibrio barjaei]|uniref:ribosomal protein S18-alanine N-acetyltransferase n=1 Tax=Vibrio barjaei TaxID=1676683 RepID=UPI0007BC42F9|nr:ribosomal protein S18-alanine N-acetyltransferase [Vibrio barjaei]OIN28164.1 ribosomal-protein-alanine N-acetyltransferase [Vibrio barjaei]